LSEGLRLDDLAQENLLTLWNPARRREDSGPRERMLFYKRLGEQVDNPGLFVLLTIPLILFEQNAVVGEEKILSVGTRALVSAARAGSEELRVFATNALHFLHKRNVSENVVMQALVSGSLRKEQIDFIIGETPEGTKESLGCRINSVSGLLVSGRN